jgi:hypothetical protein
MNNFNRSNNYPLRSGIMGLVAVSLLAGLWAALIRIGWSLPVISTPLPAIHGPLMISGVLGTLIALERAAALAGTAQKRWHPAYLVPFIGAVGAMMLIFIGGELLPGLLILASSSGLVVVFAFILRRELALHTITMTIGALFQVIAVLFWLTGSPIYQTVHTWIAFLVLTVVGERLELSRVRRLPPRANLIFAVIVGGYASAVIATFFALDLGIRVAGIGQIALALWLFNYDITTQTIRKSGQPRFIAACLLSGYAWLIIGGLIGMLSGTVYAGFAYDALLHSLLLGFIFSMIFGHALVIFPALTGKLIPFRQRFYACLIAFHVSMLLRIAGDLIQDQAVRRWGGLLNVLTILLFLGTIAQTVVTVIITAKKQTFPYPISKGR